MHHNLEIVPGADKPMSPEQLLFNSRIEKINVWKKKLNTVRLKIDAIKKRRNEEVGSLEYKLKEREFDLVKKLDTAYEKYKLNKKERRDFLEVILELTTPLRANFHNEDLHKLHDKYMEIMEKNIAKEQEGMSQEEIDQELGEMTNLTKEMIKEMIFEQSGIELEDEDLDEIDINDPNSMHNIMGRILEKMQQQEQEHFQQKTGSKRQKSKAQEEKTNEKINDLNKTGRQIYTELIKLLHPDRSKDDDERSWKTEAIKEVTEAYEQNDFYALLQLQIKYIEKAAGDIKELTGKRLNHYNGLLLQQMKDLQQQYEFLTKHGPESMIYRELGKSKKRFNDYIREEKYELEEKIEDVEDDLSNLNTKADMLSFVQYSLNPPLFNESILEMLFGE